MQINNVLNVPNLSEKGNTNVNAYLGLSHAEIQAAFSPIQNVGVMVNTYFNASLFAASGTNNIDFALGAYQLCKGKVFFDTYLGYGIGNREYFKKSSNDAFGVYDYFHIYNFSTQFNKQFVQASIFYKEEKFSTSATCQIGNIHYNTFKGVYSEYKTLTNQSVLSKQETINSLENENVKYINMAVSLKMGGKNVKFIAQPYYYLTLSDLKDFNQDIIYMNKIPYGINLGLNFTIH